MDGEFCSSEVGGAQRRLYSAFQIDELHRHSKNLVGTLHNKNVFMWHTKMSLLWYTDIINTVWP